MNPVESVLTFLAAINQHDLDKLAERMTEDHVFIDALGNPVRGREKMRAGWRAYFAMCPDYRVSHEDIFHSGNTVAAFGSAGGTIRVNGELLPENKWQTPAAWRAVVHEGLIREPCTIFWRNRQNPQTSKPPRTSRSPVSKSLQRNSCHRKAARQEPSAQAPSDPFA